ncbi:hypothetical protein IJM86_08505 [bacterium]|nr:hypothetical protein [bacterium]
MVGKLTLPDETLKKIIKEKAKIEQLPFLENFVDDTKQELDAHGKAIETDTVIQDTRDKTEDLAG